MLKIKDYAGSSRDQLSWKWNKGEQTAVWDFADPVHSSATYRVCLYDASGNAQPLLEADVPPAGTCGQKPCWKASSTGFTYRSSAGSPDGIIKLTLKAGLAGKAKIQVTAKGENLQTPALPLTLPITAQLVIVDGDSSECWQTTFTFAAMNDPSRLTVAGP